MTDFDTSRGTADGQGRGPAADPSCDLGSRPGADPSCDLFAFDMDGTLLNGRKEPDAEALAAVRAVTARGKAAVIASGRGYCQLAEYRQALDAAGFGYFVCCNGANVYDREGHALLTGTLDASDVRLLLEVCEGLDAMQDCIICGQVYVQEDQFLRMAHWDMGMYQDLHARTSRFVDDMPRWMLEHQGEISKLNPHFTSGEVRDRVWEALMQRIGGELVKAETTSLEITPAGMSKGTGVMWLAKQLGIPRERVGAVGDSGNDLPLLQAVGVPVAMGNAYPEVKAVCRFEVADNEHHGCAEVVRRFLG